MALTGLIQGLLTGGQVGLSLFGQRQAEKTYFENVQAVLEAGKVNAQRAQQEGAIRRYQQQYAFELATGQNVANLAARGGHLSGSALDVMAMQDQVHKMNLDLITYQAGLTSRNAMIDTRNQLIGLQTDLANTRLRTTGQVVGIAATAYDRFNQNRFNKNLSKLMLYNQREQLALQRGLFGQATQENYGVPN